jgi:hypothetical protein
MRPERQRRSARRGACLAAIVSLFAAAAHAQPACPFSPDALKGAFGIAFAAGTPEPGIGTGCVYRTTGGSMKNGTDFSVGVFVNASMPEQTRQMMLMGGRKHELVPVAGDADKAVVVRHRGDVPAFPQVAYVRGGRDVMLQVTGLGFEPDEKARTRRIDDVNAKLLKLPRLP